jgi:hypothetical protein
MADHFKNTDITEQYTSEGSHEAPPEDIPMTEEQAVLLKQLCEQAHEPQTFDGELTKSEASVLIREMRLRISLPQ